MRIRDRWDAVARGKRESRAGAKPQYLARAKALAVSVTPAQLDLIREQWGGDEPSRGVSDEDRDKVPRPIRRSERGTVPEKITGCVVLLLLGLLFLIWLHYVNHGLLP